MMLRSCFTVAVINLFIVHVTSGIIDSTQLLKDIDVNGFVGALADWSNDKGLKFTDLLADGDLIEHRQCTLPPASVKECSCFEIFNMAELWLRQAPVDEEEYKQRFKRAARFYHPDKEGGSNEHMIHLKSCSALLRDPMLKDVRKEYIVEMKKTLAKCKTQSKKRSISHGECYRSEVEMLHDCELGICLTSPKLMEGNLPGADLQASAAEFTDKGIIERLVVLLDDSYSMDGWKLESAKEALASIMPRIERTPTDIHFIRSKRGPEGFVSMQAFDYSNSSISYHDVAANWKVCCTTYLWEYAYSVVSPITTPYIEVIIITDGEDNDSGEQFNGPEGFSHMMNLFTQVGRKPRFRVYCIGSEACTGKSQHYRDLALATGGTFATSLGADPTDAKTGLRTFSHECNAPFLERKQRATDAQNKYQDLLAGGDAKKYDWAYALSNEPANDGNAHAPEL